MATTTSTIGQPTLGYGSVIQQPRSTPRLVDAPNNATSCHFIGRYHRTKHLSSVVGTFFFFTYIDPIWCGGIYRVGDSFFHSVGCVARTEYATMGLGYHCITSLRLWSLYSINKPTRFASILWALFLIRSIQFFSQRITAGHVYAVCVDSYYYGRCL